MNCETDCALLTLLAFGVGIIMTCLYYELIRFWDVNPRIIKKKRGKK